MKKKIFQTILIDVDDTLLDFGAWEREAIKHSFSACGYPMTEQIFSLYQEINHDLWRRFEKGEISKKTIFDTRFVKLFEEANISGDGVAFEKIYQPKLGEGVVLIDGAIELLGYMQKKYDIYIVTNGVSKTQKSKLHLSKIEEYVKDVFISEDIGYNKPMREFYEYCFTHIGKIDKTKTIVIGDSLTSDMLGGENAGIVTCWYNPKERINDLGVQIDYEIKTLYELYEIL